MSLPADCDGQCIGQSPQCLPKPAQSRSARYPFLDSAFHFIVGHEAPLPNVVLRFLNGCEKGDLLVHVAEINVIRQPLNRRQNLVLDAHAGRLRADSKRTRAKGCRTRRISPCVRRSAGRVASATGIPRHSQAETAAFLRKVRRVRCGREECMAESRSLQLFDANYPSVRCGMNRENG